LTEDLQQKNFQNMNFSSKSASATISTENADIFQLDEQKVPLTKQRTFSRHKSSSSKDLRCEDPTFDKDIHKVSLPSKPTKNPPSKRTKLDAHQKTLKDSNECPEFHQEEVDSADSGSLLHDSFVLNRPCGQSASHVRERRQDKKMLCLEFNQHVLRS
jgi:hypothetical protein